MKKLFSLLSLVVLLGISVNVMGADTDTGTTPYVGSPHTYTVVPANGANTLLWWVSTGINDEPGVATSTYAGGGAFTFTKTGGGNAVGGTPDLVATITVKPTATGVYYIHVRETSTLIDGAGGATGCSSERVFTVTPQAIFDLLTYNVSANTASATDVASDVCWTSDAPTVVSQTLNDDGTGKVTFRVAAVGIVDAGNWKFTYTNTPTDCTITSVTVADEDGGAAVAIVGGSPESTGTITVTGNADASLNDYVLVTINVSDATQTTSLATVLFQVSNAVAYTDNSVTTLTSTEVSTAALSNDRTATLSRPTTANILTD